MIRGLTHTKLCCMLIAFIVSINYEVIGFVHSSISSNAAHTTSQQAKNSVTTLSMAQVPEQEAKKGIDKVVAALQKDKTANDELGRLDNGKPVHLCRP